MDYWMQMELHAASILLDITQELFISSIPPRPDKNSRIKLVPMDRPSDKLYVAESLSVEVGKRIKNIRLRKGMTQLDLALEVHLDDTTVSRHERGFYLSLDILPLYAEALGCSLASSFPSDWGSGWDHVTIAVTTENQWAADKRLPVYLSLPLRHKSIMVEPMIGPVKLRTYFRDYPGMIESVSVGGESGPDARSCDFSWVLDLHCQCVESGVSFSYHQTGARLIKNGKEYQIPREYQHTQAAKAHLDYDGTTLLSLHEMPGE